MELKVTRIYSRLEMEELSALNVHWGWVKVEERVTRRFHCCVSCSLTTVSLLMGLFNNWIFD